MKKKHDSSVAAWMASNNKKHSANQVNQLAQRSDGQRFNRQRPWLASLLLRRNSSLLSRAARYYQQLRALPRRIRRQWQRSAVTLAGTALLLALSQAPLAHAAAINVDDGHLGVADDGFCSLIEAIISANDDDAPFASAGECEDGSGADILYLPANGNFSLTESYGYYYDSDTGLPPISSEITIEGNGSTIERDTADKFRLFAVLGGDLTLNEITLTGGYAYSPEIEDEYGGPLYFGGGGAVLVKSGTVVISNSTISNNMARDDGGGLYSDYGSIITITNSTISNNVAADDGGGADFSADSVVTITETTISGNEAGEDGGGIDTDNDSTVMIYRSTISGNEAGDSAGGIDNGPDAYMLIVNSTISGNEADYAGGLDNEELSTLILINSTISANTAATDGGGLYNHEYGDTTLTRSLISGNEAANGREVYNYDDGGDHYGTINADDFNLFGYDNDAGTVNFLPGASDIVPGPGVQINDILAPLVANGGPTRTHGLLNGSPAIDQAPNADCAAAPVSGVDQRGEPRDVDGDDSVSANECDIGAFEGFVSQQLYLTAETPGTTSDGVSFDKEDILQWDGSNWSLFFDGSAAGLTSHDVNGIHVNAADDLYLTFFQNKIMTADLGQVFGHDVIHYDGSDFSFFFDGSDVGLSTTSEKLDGLHLVEDDSDLPGGGSCAAYLLVSTFGTGKVPAAAGGTLNFQGEDVLGFCATNTGGATAGFWYMVLDGSAEGMPKNATFSLSADVAVQRLYLTTKGPFHVDSADGSHSMVYVYDRDSGEFSGPVFSAPANGLNQKVNGLHVKADTP